MRRRRPTPRRLLHETRNPLAWGQPHCTRPRPSWSTPRTRSVAPGPRAVPVLTETIRTPTPRTTRRPHLLTRLSGPGFVGLSGFDGGRSWLFPEVLVGARDPDGLVPSRSAHPDDAAGPDGAHPAGPTQRRRPRASSTPSCQRPSHSRMSPDPAQPRTREPEPTQPARNQKETSPLEPTRNEPRSRPERPRTGQAGTAPHGRRRRSRTQQAGTASLPLPDDHPKDVRSRTGAHRPAHAVHHPDDPPRAQAPAGKEDDVHPPVRRCAQAAPTTHGPPGKQHASEGPVPPDRPGAGPSRTEHVGHARPRRA